MLRNWVVRWGSYTLALLALSSAVPQMVHFGDAAALLSAALVLLLLNLTIKPILTLIALPVSLITLGLFSLVINAWMILLSARLVGGFEIAGFWAAVLAAVTVLLTTGAMERLFRARRVDC